MGQVRKHCIPHSGTGMWVRCLSWTKSRCQVIKGKRPEQKVKWVRRENRVIGFASWAWPRPWVPDGADSQSRILWFPPRGTAHVTHPPPLVLILYEIGAHAYAFDRHVQVSQNVHVEKYWLAPKQTKTQPILRASFLVSHHGEIMVCNSRMDTEKWIALSFCLFCYPGTMETANSLDSMLLLVRVGYTCKSRVGTWVKPVTSFSNGLSPNQFKI